MLRQMGPDAKFRRRWATRLGVEYATGVGEANLAFSFITYTGSAIGCAVGVVK